MDTTNNPPSSSPPPPPDSNNNPALAGEDNKKDDVPAVEVKTEEPSKQEAPDVPTDASVPAADVPAPVVPAPVPSPDPASAAAALAPATDPPPPPIISSSPPPSEAPKEAPKETPKEEEQVAQEEPAATTEAAAEGEKEPPKRRTTLVHLEVGNNMAFDMDVPSELAVADSTKRRTLMDDEEFLRAKGEDVPIWFQHRRIHNHTCQCCGIMCGLWVLSLIVLVLASIAFGSVAFDIGVPFYDRAEINQEREDAYLATERDADYVATIKQTADGSSLCVHEDPTVMTRNGTLIKGPAPGENCQLASTQSLRILYISSDRTSNILTSENLQQIKKIEEEFLNHAGLSQYCHLIATNYSAFTTRDVQEIVATLEESAGATEFKYRSCSRIQSALNFMDELYFIPDTGLGYHLMNEDIIPQEYDLEQSNIDEVVDYWSNYRTTTYNLADFPAAVQSVGDQITLPNIFWSVTSSDFVTGSTEAVGLLSTYDMGLPINGFASSSQRATEQYEEVGTWLWEEYDEFLKNAGFPGVDVYFSDTENQMLSAETGALAIQSFSLLPASIIFVLLYLMYMQDSFYIGAVGVMQILLCFIPGLIIYTYVFQITYLGVLNLIAIYIILGIGVDNLFVFCEQWKHHAYERRFDQRLQKTFNVASKAMFATSCTTFIAFISNASSAFPAIRCFGIFAAVLVLVNFCAIIFFFPAAFGLYYKVIRSKWYDHPSRLFCCNRNAWNDDVYIEDDTSTVAENADSGVAAPAKKLSGESEEKEPTATGLEELQPQADGKEKIPTAEGEEVDSEEEVKDDLKKEQPNDGGDNNDDDDDLAKKEAEAGPTHTESSLVRFFRDTWAPIMIKMRFITIIFYIGVFMVAIYLAAQLEPDDGAPNTLPDDNPYRLYSDVLIEYFARAGNPQAINVYWLAGINPDDPIDRTGTDDTNTTDYGIANYVDCSVYNPTTMEAQVWSLNTCQDMFFGNVSQYHDDTDDYGRDGTYGPEQRKILTERVPYSEDAYYQLVSCPHQGLRDWLLTDFGCTALQRYGLPCHDETSARPNCTTWDTNGNSCEPYPLPPQHYAEIFEEWLLDPNFDPTTRQTNYDKYYREVFAAEVPDLDEFQQDQILRDDFTCRAGDNLVLLSISSTAVLDQSFQQNYEDGIALYELWDQWSIQMRKHAPREMASAMQTSNGVWSFYYLNETLLSETYSNIALSLVLSFIVLCLVGGNPIMAFFSVATIALIVVDIFAFTVLMGFKLGVLEAVNYVVVIGLSIDYTVHLSEAYTSSHAADRKVGVTHMLEEMGVSVLSGAISTLGACFFMFFAPNTFFVKFAAFIFATIALSCLYSLTFFPALLACIGPTGNTGNCFFWGAKRCRQMKHKMARDYIETEEFKRRELVARYQSGEIETLFEC